MSEQIEHIAIIGGGQMGAGIAQVALQSGYGVTVVERSDAGCDRCRSRIEKGFGRLVEKGRLPAEDRDRMLGALALSMDRGDAARAQLVIEAVTEDPQVKYELFAALDAICSENTILASNTSSISITRIAAATKRPDRVIGMHFMNPVPVMKLVEIIEGLATSQETAATIRAVCGRLGKEVVVAQDYPGFIVNRILLPMINEACYALMEGVGSAEDIDQAMMLGTNQPMGPLTLADFIGLDTCLAILEVLHDGLGDAKYRPCPLLRKYVDAGFVGRKVGRGFHTYPSR